MNINDQEAKVPPSFQISRQLDQEKINFLTKRIEELLKSNNELRTGASQNEKDTHDIVLYFQREMEIKDDIILKLNEELVKCQTQLKFEVEKIRKAFEQEINELKTTSEHTITSLTNKLEAAETELKGVEIYKREKDLQNESIRKLEKSLQQQREQLIDAMEEQERRFLEEKAQIFKELDDQKAAFREIALNEARASMSEEVKKILADNNRMSEELKFHHSEAVAHQAEKNKLAADLVAAKRDLAILSEKEIEYAKQAYNRSKEIKVLRERVEQLEKQQAVNIEKFKLRAKELKATVTKELEEATMDSAGLRRLLQIKNKELRHMKSLAATILSQRTETEQFFLESLQEVKEVIKQEKRAKQIKETGVNTRMTKVNAYGNNSSLPPLQVRPANLHLLEPRRKQPEIPLEDLDKISISELNWEDKELILRVLFAKMNGQQKQVEANQKAMYSSSMNKPVFISEGAQLAAEAQMGLNHFEMNESLYEDEPYDAKPNYKSAGREGKTLTFQTPGQNDATSKKVSYQTTDLLNRFEKELEDNGNMNNSLTYSSKSKSERSDQFHSPGSEDNSTFSESTF